MSSKTIAILAGAGPMPSKAVVAAQKAGHRVLVIAITEARKRPLRQADYGKAISLMKGAQIVKALNRYQCEGVLFVGKFDKGIHGIDFSKMDEVTASIVNRFPGRADMDVGAVILEEFQDRGFPPISQLEAFKRNIAPKGVIAGPAINADREKDIQLGKKLARVLADFDVGQTIVVKDGLVVAVEAAEHSDRCIQRAGRLIEGNKCVVKVARTKQDFRFDTPVVGVKTLRTMYKAKADLLAIEAGRCLIMDENFADLADDLKISVIGI